MWHCRHSLCHQTIWPKRSTMPYCKKYQSLSSDNLAKTFNHALLQKIPKDIVMWFLETLVQVLQQNMHMQLAVFRFVPSVSCSAVVE